MKGKINFDSYKNSGGVDKVNAINYTGHELNKYDTVVISKGETKLSDYSNHNINNSYSARSIVDIAWPKKNAIYRVARFASSSYPLEIYRRYNYKWFRYNTGSNKDYDEGAGFHYTNDGKIIYYSYEYNHYCTIIDNNYNMINIPDTGIYLGQHNNKSYIALRNGNIYEYYPDTNTRSANSLYSAGSISYGTIWDGKIILATATKITVLSFDTDDSIKLESANSYSNVYPRAITGCKYGDYMFTSTTIYTHNISTGASMGYLKCYKLATTADGKYSYTEYTPTILEKFTTQVCTINYNHCTGLLGIGTVDGAYLYKFNRYTKEFTEIPINVELPEKDASAIYRVIPSPDGSEVLIATFNANTITTIIGLTGYNQTVALPNDLENIGPKEYTAQVMERSLPEELVETTGVVPNTVNITFNISPSANNLILIEGEN